MILPLLSFLIHSWTFKPTMVGSDLFSGCCHMFLTLSDVLGWWVLLVFWIWWVWWVLWVRVGGCGILSFPNPLDLGSGLVLRTPWERPIWLSYMIWTTNTASHFYLIVWYQKIVDGATRTFVHFCLYALLDLWERAMYFYLKIKRNGFWEQNFSFSPQLQLVILTIKLFGITWLSEL